MRLWPLLLFWGAVAGHYLVQLQNSAALTNFLSRHPLIARRVTSQYSFGDFHAISGNFNRRLLDIIEHSPFVKAVTQDIRVGVRDVQHKAPRHLARLSRRDKLPFIRVDPSDYYYSSSGQDNVYVYVIDTGIYSDHPEFEGRVSKGIDFTGEGFGDKNGHGTHVAGIIGSKTYGAAKRVNLVDVKVLSGEGTGNLSAVIAGIDYAVNDRKSKGNRVALANLSLGAPYNPVLNAAVNAAVDSGLPMTVAAGNTNSAACLTSPASASNALTVGAIDDRYDTIAPFSNWGSCVTLFASGVYVTSLANKGEKTLTMSGTSMAAPAVAGTLAMFLGEGYPTDVALDKITTLATVDAIDRRSHLIKPRSPNLIAYNGQPEPAAGGPGAQSSTLPGSSPTTSTSSSLSSSQGFRENIQVQRLGKSLLASLNQFFSSSPPRPNIANLNETVANISRISGLVVF